MRGILLLVGCIASFLIGYVLNMPDVRERLHTPDSGLLEYLAEQNRNTLEAASRRQEEIQSRIATLRQERIDAGRRQLAEQVQAPVHVGAEKKILPSQVQYPALRIIAQDANKRRIDLREPETAVIPRILSMLPPQSVPAFDQIIIQYGNPPGMRRGLAGGGTMFVKDSSSLSGGVNEFISVFMHEAGHVIDIAYHQGRPVAGESVFKDGAIPLYLDDPSLIFYSQNWIDDRTQKRASSPDNFVSRYAATDPFEEFAETFNVFVLQAEAFRTIAEKNPVLQHHYEFISSMLYGGKEFDSSVDPGQLDVTPRVWDTTVMPISDSVKDMM